MTKSQIAHDHVVLLLSKEDFENPPAWLSDNFNIIEGGIHSGGSSRNKLIIFKDGTYLELFTWISEPTEFHAWADKPPGLIDFALTTLDPITAKDNYETITAGLKSSEQASTLGVTFLEPQSGGRKRMDGVDVRWQTTRPQFGEFTTPLEDKFSKNTRLDTPFFCHDVTDRTVRVPFDDEKITSHPCGARGISAINIVVPASHVESYLAFYRTLLGTTENWYMDDEHEEYAMFEISAPNPGFHEFGASIRIYYPTWTEAWRSRGGIDELVRHENQQDRWLTERGPGIYGVVLRRAGKLSSHNTAALGTDEIGTSVRLEPWMVSGSST